MDKDIIKNNLTIEDISNIVQYLGSSPPKSDRRGNLLFQTICHGGNSHKLYYYDDIKMFHCYTHCQDNFDIYELIMRTHKDFSFVDAINFVTTYFNINANNSQVAGFVSIPKYTDDWDVIERYSRIYDKIHHETEKEISYYNSNVLNLFPKMYPQDWINEKISIDSMMKYDIRFRQSENEIIIPYWDIDQRLLGIRSRTLIENKIIQGFKYMPTMIQNKYYTHDINQTLYGLNINASTIKRIKKVMLVEAEKSVLKCDTFYKENNFTLGLSGSNLSKAQRSLLLNLGVKEVILALDKPSEEYWNDDDKKKQYIENILRIGYMLSPYMTVYVLWDEYSFLNYGDSPVDQGKEILEILMKKKQEIKSREDD